MRALRALVLGAALLGGCVEFNQECSPLVSEPDAITGWIDGDISILKGPARTQNHSLGQLVAESYFHAFDPQKAGAPDIAVENGGGIRFESPCEARDALRKGSVKRRHMREVIPFDNKVEVVKVTYRQLKGTLEHSVAAFTAAGQSNPSGAFLQLYGAEVWADCSKPGEALASDGTRTREGTRITRIVLKKRDGTDLEIPLNDEAAMASGTVLLATNSFLASGGDGFHDLGDAETVNSAGGFQFELVAEHFKRTYPKEAPLPAQAPIRVHLSDECR